MANPLGEREVRLEHPRRVGLVSSLAALALTSVLLAGCGGGDNGAKVEASLRQYISGFHPEDLPFPIGAGPPRVRDNACRDRHVETKRWQAVESRTAGRVFPFRVALWSCVIKFENLAMPVVVALNDSKEIVWVATGRFEQFKLKQYKPEQFKSK